VEQFEVIAGNDGSGDNGAALRNGFLNAKYEYVFTDNDGQFRIKEIESIKGKYIFG